MSIRAQDIDRCGLIAGTCDEMGLVEHIDKLLGTHPQEIITPGQAVKALILKDIEDTAVPCPYFINLEYAVYLFEKFFVEKATEHRTLLQGLTK